MRREWGQLDDWKAHQTCCDSSRDPDASRELRRTGAGAHAIPPTRTAFKVAPTATPLPQTVTAAPPSPTPTGTETPTSTVTPDPPTDTPLPPSATPTSASPTVLSLAAAGLEGSILFSVGQEGDIAKMNVDGSDRVVLLARVMQGDVYSDRLAAWRPDGKEISFVVDDFEKVEIWVMDGDGSNPRLLVADVAPVTSHPWSPDGTRIAFVVSGHDICILDLASQTVTNLTGEYQSDGHPSDTHLSDARDPDWSPDGSKLAFSASDGQNQDIYVISVDGTGLTGLTSHEARDGHPDWSPGGTALVVQLDASQPTLPRSIFSRSRPWHRGGGQHAPPAHLCGQARKPARLEPGWSLDCVPVA